MAHHGSDDLSPETRRLLNEQFLNSLDELMKRESARMKLGATGLFPQGKLDESDEGELKLGVAHTPEKVILNFGKPIAWIGFDPSQAREIGRLLVHHANEIERKK